MKSIKAVYNGGYWKAGCPSHPDTWMMVYPTPLSIAYCENGEFVCPDCYPGYWRMVTKNNNGVMSQSFDISARATARMMALAKDEVYKVEMPENATEIEAALLCRKEYDVATGQIKGRNWQPGETIKQIKKENKKLGLV